MTTAHDDFMNSLKKNFYKDSKGNVYAIEHYHDDNGKILFEAYKLKKEGGLERASLSVSQLSSLENVGKKSDFAEKGCIDYKHVLEKLAESEV